MPRLDGLFWAGWRYFLRLRIADSIRLHSQQLGKADQVVGDEIEQEVGGDADDPTMLGLAHRSMLLAPTEVELHDLKMRAARLASARPVHRHKILRTARERDQEVHLGTQHYMLAWPGNGGMKFDLP